MRKNREEFFIKVVKDNGIYDASKMLGIPQIKLIKLTNCYIDLSMANDIIGDLFNEGIIPWKYKNCSLSQDGFSGTLDWYCDWSGDFHNDYNNEETYSYATPFWEINDGVPVNTNIYNFEVSDGREMGFEESDLDQSQTYTFIKWKDGFENLGAYTEWIRKFYLPQVYNVISKHLDNYRSLTY